MMANTSAARDPSCNQVEAVDSPLSPAAITTIRSHGTASFSGARQMNLNAPTIRPSGSASCVGRLAAILNGQFVEDVGKTQEERLLRPAGEFFGSLAAFLGLVHE
jgi:hypothetical protein